MRLIRRRSEPPGLLAYRKTDGASYSGLPADSKSELRDALLAQQYGLCCFCSRRVGAPGGGDRPEPNVKIAHHTPRSVDRTQELEWSNLFAACLGGEGGPRGRQTCDTRQGNTILAISPCEPTHIASLHYTNAGELCTHRSDLREDIATQLNLNEEALRASRRAVLTGLQQSLARRYSGRFTKAVLQKALEDARTPKNGRLQEHAGMLEWWLEKRLSRAG